MVIVFSPLACVPHPSFPRGLHAPWLVLVLTLTLLAGCGAPPVVATLEARPSGKYGEEIRWTSARAPAGSHQVEVEIEVDEAQLMMFEKPYAVSMFVDVDVEGAGEVDEVWLNFPVTAERVISEDQTTRRITYKTAGTLQESGFRKSETKKAFGFTSEGGPVTLVAHIRTPQGADRHALKAVRTVRLVVRSRSKDAATDWVEGERRTRE